MPHRYEDEYIDTTIDEDNFDERQSPQGYDGRRNQLVSYPNSVNDHARQEIARFQQQSQQAMREAAQELARNHGDLMALLMATPYGKKEISFEHKDTTIEVTETKKYRAGMCVGKDITTKTTTKIQQRHHRLD